MSSFQEKTGTLTLYHRTGIRYAAISAVASLCPAHVCGLFLLSTLFVDPAIRVRRVWPWGLKPKRSPTIFASALTTILNHIRNARQKMREKSKLGAVLAAQRRGLL